MQQRLKYIRGVIVSAVLVGFAFAPVPAAAAAGPFAAWSGKWGGTGQVNYTNGPTERIKCNATYTASNGGNGLRIKLDCASQGSPLHASATVRVAQDGVITGSFTESVNELAGSVAGSMIGSTTTLVLRDTTGYNLSMRLSTTDTSQSVILLHPQESVENVTFKLQKK